MTFLGLRGLRDDASTAPLVQPLDMITKLSIAALLVSVAQLSVELFQLRRRKDR